jgi:hypothetical protein
MKNIVITESARSKTKLTTKVYNQLVKEASASNKEEGVTKLGIMFRKIANSIYLF